MRTASALMQMDNRKEIRHVSAPRVTTDVPYTTKGLVTVLLVGTGVWTRAHRTARLLELEHSGCTVYV